MLNQKVAIITGSSSGIGYETVLLLARNGFYTYATMRNLEQSKVISHIAEKENLQLHAMELDVTDEKSVNDAIKKIKSDTGRIDVLVNNAGYGLAGSLEDLSMNEIKLDYEINVFGLIRVTQAVLPTMREQKSGIIVNMSAMGGKFGLPMFSPNTSTKFAVEGLSECIAYELEPFGIKVIIIEPGVIKTNFYNSMAVAKKGLDPSSPYFKGLQQLQGLLKSFLANGSLPTKVAEVILKAITTPNPDLRYPVGDDAYMLLQKRKEISDSEFQKLIFESFKKI